MITTLVTKKHYREIRICIGVPVLLECPHYKQKMQTYVYSKPPSDVKCACTCRLSQKFSHVWLIRCVNSGTEKNITIYISLLPSPYYTLSHFNFFFLIPFSPSLLFIFLREGVFKKRGKGCTSLETNSLR